MAWFQRVCRWAGAGLDLLYPPRCVVCGEEGDPPAEPATWPRFHPAPPVCPTCTRGLVGTVPRCLGCGERVADAGRPASCPRCVRGGGRDLDGIVVLGGYEGDLRTRVLEAKRPAGRLVAAGLARLLVERHRDVLLGWGIDLVVPVPMHWLRRSLRGMSSADELARWVAAGLGAPCEAGLRRRRPTRMQNELPWEERRGNVRDAFRTRRPLAGRRLLLIDDVTTTGATLAACRAAAVADGAAAVHAAVVARADRDADG